jgi:hypothetical protein
MSTTKSDGMWELLPAPPAEEAHCDNISITSLALPEAPASLNFRAMIHGYEVQVTLRDSDETRLLARLAALVQQSPLRSVPKPAPRHGQWRKAPH